MRSWEPLWYYNPKKNPHIELQNGPVKRDYLAREVTVEEKAVWWERAVATYLHYAEYQRRQTARFPSSSHPWRRNKEPDRFPAAGRYMALPFGSSDGNREQWTEETRRGTRSAAGSRKG